MIKEWFTLTELAEFQLSDLPSGQSGLLYRTNKENWLSRARKASGGGKEYHFSNLSPDQQAELVRKLVKSPNIKTEEADFSIEGLNDSQVANVKAKLWVIDIFKQYHEHYQSLSKASKELVADYGNGNIEVPAYVKGELGSFSNRTLMRWHEKSLKDKKLLADGNLRRKRGRTKIDKDQELSDFIVGLLFQKPNIKSKHIMRAMRAEFRGRKELPSYRRTHQWVCNYRKKNEAILLNIANPDGYKNKFQPASGSASEDIFRVNQVWEFDSTPADILLIDGKRYNIIGVMDVYTRRLKLLVSKTSKAAAVSTLIRRAVLSWGVPEIAKLDNGADYKSKQIAEVCNWLGIAQDFCQPFTPEGKPHIERAFKTFSHGILELMPNYIGHNVADRKAIEARKSFANRLGDKGDLELGLSVEEFQAFCDEWCENLYMHEKHGTLGCSPYEFYKRADKSHIKTVNERALDIALTEVKGFRTVTKKGIRLDNTYYSKDILGLFAGKQVKVRYDADDWGIIYVFNENNEFICKALSPERMGISREDEAKARKQLQAEYMANAKKELRKKARAINAKDIHKKIMVDAKENASKFDDLPVMGVEHSNHALQQAKIAANIDEYKAASELNEVQKQQVQKLEEEEKQAKKQSEKRDPKKIYQEYKRLVIKNNMRVDDITAVELKFIQTYRKSRNYKFYESLDPAPVEFVL